MSGWDVILFQVNEECNTDWEFIQRIIYFFLMDFITKYVRKKDYHT